MVRRVLNVLRARLCHNETDQAFIRREARALHRFRFEAFGGYEFEIAILKAEIDRAHIGHEGPRDQLNDTGQTPIQTASFGHKLPQPRHENARRNSSYRTKAIRMRHLGDRVSYVTASSS